MRISLVVYTSANRCNGSQSRHLQLPYTNKPLQALFAATVDSAESVTISVAMLEIYNESVRDLLGGLSPPTLEVSGLGPGELQPGALPRALPLPTRMPAWPCPRSMSARNLGSI